MKKKSTTTLLTNSKENLFGSYHLAKIEDLCAEVWPLVNDYLINEIDNNASILKDSVTANSIIKCIEYICTDETSSLFRNGRSAFSVIIRLHQTEKISSAELSQAFYDNHVLLLRWFEVLIRHACKEEIPSEQIQSFYALFSAHVNNQTKTHNFITYALSKKP